MSRMKMDQIPAEDHYQALFDHNYLRWFDLQDSPALVKIVKVEPKVELTLPGGVKSRKPVIHLIQLQGKIEPIEGDRIKPLVLNVTNSNAIAEIHGPAWRGWFEKDIVLERTQRQLRGKMVDAIGIRARKDSKDAVSDKKAGAEGRDR